MNFPVNPSRVFLTLSLIVFLATVTSANNWWIDPGAFEREFTEQTAARHPYVALLPGAATSGTANDGELVRLQDLRGVECYAQPDQLNVCGTGDTIPILLFTKSTTPIEDISLTVRFDDGLEYSGFAYAAAGPAELTEDNINNLGAPSFVLSELSQAGGGVVVYIGVSASCGLNLDVLNPGITFVLDYETPAGACFDERRPEDPYGSNVSVPEVVFNGEPSPASLDLVDRDQAMCTTIPITQVTMGAGALGAILTVSDYGFDDGVTVSGISVGGTSVPGSAVTADDSGDLTIVLDTEQTPGYFGGDGALSFGENADVQLCFAADSCFAGSNPQLSVVFACRGERCAGNPDFETDLMVNNAFDFNVDWQISDVQVLQQPSVCGTDGDPDNFIVQYTLSNPVGDYRADLTNLQFILDRCTSFTADTVYLAGANPGPLPARGVGIVRNENSNFIGRVIINLDNPNLDELATDPDGPGVGLDDLDGDGRFDDLPGDQSITIVFEMSPAEADGDLTCASSLDFCDFTRVRVVGFRDCGSEGIAPQAPIPGNNSFMANSSAGIGGDTMTYTYSQTTYPGGLDFGVVGRSVNMPGPPNISVSKNVIFSYELDPNDGIACATVGSRQVVVDYSTLIRGPVVDMELDQLTGGTLVANEFPGLDSTTQRWRIDVPANVDMNDVEFRLTLDTNLCLPRIQGDISIFVVDDCDGCSDATKIRTCSTAPVSVNPDNFPECQCDYESGVEMTRVTTGFTDRSLTDRLAPEETADRGEVVPQSVVDDIDTLQVMPGDTIRFDLEYIVTNEESWNNLDYLAFSLAQLTPSQTTIRNTLTHIFEAHQARLQRVVLDRPGQPEQDLGGVSGGPTNLFGGIFVGAGNAAGELPGTDVPQPGLSTDDFIFRQGTTAGDLSNDGNRIILIYRDEFGGGNNALTELYNEIGGSFQNGDTIRLTWQIPMMEVPDELAGGVPLQKSIDFSRVFAFPDGRTYTASGAFSTNTINGVVDCTERPIMRFYSPDPKVEATLDFAAGDGTGNDPAFASCDAELVIDYTIDNPPPSDFYRSEYRPILGIEDFTAVIPSSYYYVPGTATVEVLNGGISRTFNFASTSGDSVTVPGNTKIIVADPNPVTIKFSDSENQDGTNWMDYATADDGMRDVTLVGGDLPLLGVGLGESDTLRISIPLQRLCPENPSTDLQFFTDLSYPNIPDYETPMYDCNTQPWYPAATSCPDGVDRYFPYNRESADNPHRFQEAVTVTTVNAPAQVTDPMVTIDQPFLIDLMGTETNTYTLTTPDAIPGGVVAIEVSNAVDLIAVTGDATTFTTAATGDTSVIYAVELPALNAGETFTMELETELVQCARANIRLSAVLGCGGEERATVVASFENGCGANVSYFYVSGQADLATTFDYPSNQNGCGVATYTVQYRNQGTSDLDAFQPILFIPEGIDLIPGTFEVRTISPGSGPVAIIDPTENTDTTGVFGRGFVWPNAYFADPAFGTDRIEEGEIVLLTFDAQPTCDFMSGLPIASKVNASAACERALSTDPSVGPPINLVQVPDPAAPAFTFQVEDNRISCAPGALPLTLTAINTGKGTSDESNLCFVLPAGLSLTSGDIRAVAPTGYQPGNFTTRSIGTGGATEICFDGPSGIGTGGFFCLNVDLDVGDIDCGPVSIGAQLTRTATIECAGVVCEVEVLASDGLLDLEVVPPVDVTEAELFAACSDIPGSTDLTFSLDFENIAARYTDQATFEVIFDADSNGEINPGEPVIATQTQTINLAGGATTTIEVVTTVPENQACPVILRVTLPGCTCSELVFPFSPVEPEFLADVGDNIVLCPGGSAAIGPLCGTFDVTIDPPLAGTAVQDGEFIIVTLNDGFGVDAPVTLRATNEIGACGTQAFSVTLSALEDFAFGPYAVSACSEGCTTVDLGIASTLREDLAVTFTPGLYLDDPLSQEPRLCDPVMDTEYTIEFSLNEDSCVTTALLELTVVEPPTLTVVPGTVCSTGGNLDDRITVSDAALGATITVRGDGTFTGSSLPPLVNPDFPFPQARLGDDAVYTPGPDDRRAGSFTVSVRTDNPDGPCGGVRASAEFEVLIVDCGQPFWDGER